MECDLLPCDYVYAVSNVLRNLPPSSSEKKSYTGNIGNNVQEQGVITLMIRVNFLMVFESRVPRNMDGPKRDELAGGWRKLYNEELHRLTTVIKSLLDLKWARHVACMKEIRNGHNICRKI